MLTEVKTYSTGAYLPSDRDITLGIDAANNNDCVVHITWWWRQTYTLIINPGDTLEECKARLPKKFSV